MPLPPWPFPARTIGYLQDRARVPQVAIPDGRWLHLPGRGRTWLTEVGPPDGPPLVLLHAVGCTGLLTWFPALPRLAQRYRVVVFDQRWHGRGIMSKQFSLHDCADDVAAVIHELGLVDPIVAGYSMGGVIAQRTWRQHPASVGGLVLAATTDHFRTTGSERVFHESMELSMGALHTLSRSRVAGAAGRRTARALQIGPTDTGQWALGQWRSTSPWAVGEAVAALGRHHSTPWLSRIDVPTAVVVTSRDRVMPAQRQRAMAARIPGAVVHEADCGHAGCVLGSEAFVPALVQAANTVQARIERLT
ncbi:MAG: alpha/beta fold hydrolase [Marmoricola sp.]